MCHPFDISFSQSGIGTRRVARHTLLFRLTTTFLSLLIVAKNDNKNQTTTTTTTTTRTPQPTNRSIVDDGDAAVEE